MPNSNPRVPDDDSWIKGGNWISQKIESWLGHHTPKCSEMTRLISEEMDRPLPLKTRIKMQLHYVMCCYCLRYKRNLIYIQEVLKGIHKYTEKMSTTELSPEVKDRMKQALKDEGDDSH